jgi:hypothetical protein
LHLNVLFLALFQEDDSKLVRFLFIFYLTISPFPEHLQTANEKGTHAGITDVCPTVDTSRPCLPTYHIYLLGPHPHGLEEMHVPFHGFYYSHPCLSLCCVCACLYKLFSSPTHYGYSLNRVHGFHNSYFPLTTLMCWSYR